MATKQSGTVLWKVIFLIFALMILTGIVLFIAYGMYGDEQSIGEKYFQAYTSCLSSIHPPS
ncbi:hypothetical protein [Pontibacillus yanchengensis]|uniref:Uncharacterized protein n=1 Tax=Pontibacillus yanchengensis Y32 TaxID=1385514 RepID=A0A0A2T8D8_9BACI|nr:hypothetical protein [Pontibacillus yanchengensis]KGP71784.1 hypothetical protein N782_16625 [Pontibacillus yanchengensis Y32]